MLFGTDIYSRALSVIWTVFIVYWAVSALAAKKSAGSGPHARRQAAIRLGVLALIVAVWSVPSLRLVMQQARSLIASNTGAPSDVGGVAGVALCAMGVALAFWARICMGSNWGMPMSRKENPELVTNGPYAFIRHPIYTGILFAMLGSAVAEGHGWPVALAVAFVYFIYSARGEEKLMLEQFPQQYAEYMKRTKMLLPFVF